LVDTNIYLPKNSRKVSDSNFFGTLKGQKRQTKMRQKNKKKNKQALAKSSSLSNLRRGGPIPQSVTRM